MYGAMFANCGFTLNVKKYLKNKYNKFNNYYATLAKDVESYSKKKIKKNIQRKSWEKI